MESSFYLLEMAHIVRGVHQVGSFAKEGMNTSGNNHGLNLSLFASGSRVYFVPRFLGGGQRLSGQSRLQKIADKAQVLPRESAMMMEPGIEAQIQSISLEIQN